MSVVGTGLGTWTEVGVQPASAAGLEGGESSMLSPDAQRGSLELDCGNGRYGGDCVPLMVVLTFEKWLRAGRNSFFFIK